MANRFDKHLPGNAPAPLDTRPAPPTVAAPPLPVEAGDVKRNRFDKYVGPSSLSPSPLPPGAVDWSNFNKPFGTIGPATWSPTERMAHDVQDVLIKGGANPYMAGHIGRGVIDTARLNPIVNLVTSAGDLGYHLPRGEYVKSALDALGLAPAALYGTKFVKGQSMVPNADIPRGRFDKSYLPERQLFGQPDQYGMRPGGSYGPALPSSLRPVDENRLFAVQKYNQVAASPVTYQPNSINDYIYRTANELRQGGMHGQAHTPENSPEYYALLTRWYNDHAGRATPVTALELDQLRQDLRGLPSGTYSGIAGGKAADRLDIYMHTPPPGQVASGTQSELDDLRSNIEDARGAWRSYKTADTIEQSLVDAKNSAAVHRRDEGQAVQNVLDQYANSPAGRQAIFGATQNELATIGQAAKGDLGNRALNKMGDILTTGKASGAGGLAGGALGGALGLDWTTAAALATAGASLPPAAGTVMRWGAQPGMARKAQEALDTIRMNSPLYQQRVTGSPAPPPQGFTPYGGPATAGPPIGGNPPVENANVMARDAVTYALMPQIQKKGEDVWSGTDMPFEAMPNPEAGRNIEPTMFGGWTLPDRKIIHPPIPRVYIDQPAESYDPALENR